MAPAEASSSPPAHHTAPSLTVWPPISFYLVLWPNSHLPPPGSFLHLPFSSRGPPQGPQDGSLAFWAQAPFQQTPLQRHTKSPEPKPTSSCPSSSESQPKRLLPREKQGSGSRVLGFKHKFQQPSSFLNLGKGASSHCASISQEQNGNEGLGRAWAGLVSGCQHRPARGLARRSPRRHTLRRARS